MSNDPVIAGMSAHYKQLQDLAFYGRYEPTFKANPNDVKTAWAALQIVERVVLDQFP